MDTLCTHTHALYVYTGAIVAMTTPLTAASPFFLPLPLRLQRESDALSLVLEPERDITAGANVRVGPNSVSGSKCAKHCANNKRSLIKRAQY